MSLPQIKHCVICEDIRLEQRNLASLMGVYGITPYVSIRIREFALHVSFCSVFYGPPFKGKIDIQLELRTPDGTPIEVNTFPKQNELTFSDEFPVAFSLKLNALFPIPDTYTLVLLGNGVEFFTDTLKIVQGKAIDFFQAPKP
jgi:hypothetical protein